jgi:glycosyltransferase involved in cell wall biosynthesis
MSLKDLTKFCDDFENNRLELEALTLHSANISLELNDLFKEQAYSTKEVDQILQGFYNSNSNFVIPLANNIITETLNEIKTSKKHFFCRQPEITYIVPVYNCNEKKFYSTLQSIHEQIGVKARAIVIIDGPSSDDLKKVQNALQSLPQVFQTRIIQKEKNGGVAKARNTGMKEIQTEFFSWIDANDLIHPLRSIYAILTILNNDIDRLNTAYARIDLVTKKIFLRNHNLYFIGHTSFVAKTDLIQTMGYLMDFKYHEDTEYEQRLKFFNIPLSDSNIVAHYLDLESDNTEEQHLSGDTWGTREIIDKHTYLQGSYVGSITDERKRFNAHSFNYYRKVQEEMATNYFPCQE